MPLPCHFCTGSKLAPLFDGPVRGHDGRAQFVSSHDDLEEILAGLRGEFLKTHVVEDEEIGLKVASDDLDGLAQGVDLHELRDGVEDRAIENAERGLRSLMTDGLDEMGFTDTGRADEENVSVFADEPAGGKLQDLSSVDRGVKNKVDATQITIVSTRHYTDPDRKSFLLHASGRASCRVSVAEKAFIVTVLSAAIDLCGTGLPFLPDLPDLN